MEGINVFYLTLTVIELAGILIAGIYFSRQIKNTEDFALSGRNLTPLLATGTFCSTFLSALSIIGGVGYSSLHGWAYLIMLPLGCTFGLTMLQILARKLQPINAKSVPNLLYLRYENKTLQAVSALIIVFAYVFTLITQLFGIGVTINTITGVPVFLAILVPGVVFVTYTSFGGFFAVARTDTIQFFIILVGLIFSGIWVVSRLGIGSFFTPEYTNVFVGSTPNIWQSVAWTCVWGFGIAAQPYYLQRILACPNKKTAYTMLSGGGLFVGVIYIIFIITGIGGAILAPNHVGDSIYPYLISNEITGILGSIITLTLLAAILTTVDSLLNIIGVYFANDVYKNLIKPDCNDKELLNISKIATFIFGFICIVLATLQSFRPLPQIAIFAGYAWGTVACGIFIPVWIGMYWKKASSKAALISSIAGFGGAAIDKYLVTAGISKIPEVFVGLFFAIVSIVIFSYILPDSKVSQNIDYFFSA
jgi:Na+/proline symporter